MGCTNRLSQYLTLLNNCSTNISLNLATEINLVSPFPTKHVTFDDLSLEEWVYYCACGLCAIFMFVKPIARGPEMDRNDS